MEKKQEQQLISVLFMIFKTHLESNALMDLLLNLLGFSKHTVEELAFIE